MSRSNDRRPDDLARQQQCWRQLWRELLKPLPPEVRADAAVVAYWPDEKPRLAGYDPLGEYAPSNVPDIGDYYDLEPDA